MYCEGATGWAAGGQGIEGELRGWGAGGAGGWRARLWAGGRLGVGGGAWGGLGGRGEVRLESQALPTTGP